MQESKPGGKQATELGEREAEATSNETLEELEHEESTDAADSTANVDSKIPSPDGSFDETNELTDADPL